MLGRLFGRTKDDRDDTVCSTCGRTLLAGEWTQRVVENDGTERYICSLCARPQDSLSADLEPTDEVTTVAGGRAKSSRADSDAFWRALKDKDAEIERLESLLARAEAEKQELAALLAQSRDEIIAAPAPETVAEPEREFVAETAPGLVAEPAPEVGADTAEFVAEPAPEVGGDTAEFVAPALLAASASTFATDDVAGVPTLEVDGGVADAPRPADGTVAVGGAPAPAPLEHTDPRLGEVLRRAAAPAEPTSADGPSGPAESLAADHGSLAAQPVEATVEAAVEAAPDEFVPLAILQRGVDLLNVSAVPKRVVETNENLGIPQVHVGAQDESTLLITFMWSMGWYQFRVELADAGRITLADRGYEERSDLRPNASARTDGTVQLAPSQIKPPTPKDTSEPKLAGVTSGVIISKSMMGQRTDDENVPADWKSKRAPDFDWGR
jgi:hypothetical protein